MIELAKALALFGSMSIVIACVGAYAVRLTWAIATDHSKSRSQRDEAASREKAQTQDPKLILTDLRDAPASRAKVGHA